MTLFNSAVRKIKHKSSKQHHSGLPLFLFFARFSKSKSLLSAQRTPLCKHVNIMNMADGFGWQPSSKTLRAEDSDSNGAIDSARQSPSFWDSVATTVKRTVSYANSEFERFFGSMGFRSPPNASNVQVTVASRVDEGYSQISSPPLTPTLDQYWSSYSNSGKHSRQSTRSSISQSSISRSRDPRRRSHSSRLQRIQELSTMLDRLRSEAEEATQAEQEEQQLQKAAEPRPLERSRTSFATAESFSDENDTSGSFGTAVQEPVLQTSPTPSPKKQERNVAKTNSVPSSSGEAVNPDYDERVARLERQIMHLQKEVAGYRESLKSITKPSAPSPIPLPPPPPSQGLPASPNPSHTRMSVPFRDNSSLPSPPSKSPIRPSSPQRSPRPNRITKPAAALPIRPHNLQGAVRVLPSSTFIRDVYRGHQQQQTNREPPNAPDKKHIGVMREIVQQIPHVKLRRTEHVPGPDGSLKTNPFWIEIYDPDRRYREKRSRYRGDSGDLEEEGSSFKRRRRTNPV
ncbi:hypothetical protein VTP01DRAFT_1754 [Rhizomucor pusillus]|uniref:uncharacterized protein n=1 Tax=Rhizomucor pusillus TaxID=4840 RepID=UPI0037429ABF